MIDSHCHIYGPKYEDDRDQVIARAQAAGVRQILVVGCDVKDSRMALDFAKSTAGVFAAVGIHPHHADQFDEHSLSELRALTTGDEVVALGEMGLDFYYDNSPRPEQQRAFEQQLILARELGMPVVIHTRDAEDETAQVLAQHPPETGGHVHCFTGSMGFASDLLDLGLHIGFTGIITFPRSEALREVVRMVPLERILIETDSPFLAPVPHRGRRNEPAYVVQVAEKIAELKQCSVEEVSEATDRNFAQLYAVDPQKHLLPAPGIVQ